MRDEPHNTDEVVFVKLRRPRKNDPRRDPLYEFGCFGLTGCHSSNLLADARAAGKRLAFAQGGAQGFRLVMLTPPVQIQSYPPKLHAAHWKPAAMPLRYTSAPLLVSNGGESDVPRLLEDLQDVARSTWEAKFASKFRSRKSPISRLLASDVIAMWTKIARSAARASVYWEALPHRPDVIDDDRDAVHAALLRKATGVPAKRGRRC